MTASSGANSIESAHCLPRFLPTSPRDIGIDCAQGYLLHKPQDLMQVLNKSVAAATPG